jgi:hypothetical protein
VNTDSRFCGNDDLVGKRSMRFQGAWICVSLD